MVNLQYTFCTKGDTECPLPPQESTSACKHRPSEPFERAHSSTGMCPRDTAPRPAACLALHLTEPARTGVSLQTTGRQVFRRCQPAPLEVTSDSADAGGVRSLRSSALMGTPARRATRLAELELGGRVSAGSRIPLSLLGWSHGFLFSKGDVRLNVWQSVCF